MPSNTTSKKGEHNMIKDQVIRKVGAYIIDLTKIDGDGTVPCPKCGNAISPDDETNETYKVIEPIMENKKFTGLLISCGSCNTQITLTGFQQLEEDIPL